MQIESSSTDFSRFTPPNLDFKGSVSAEMSVEHDEIERNERNGV